MALDGGYFKRTNGCSQWFGVGKTNCSQGISSLLEPLNLTERLAESKRSLGMRPRGPRKPLGIRPVVKKNSQKVLFVS